MKIIEKRRTLIFGLPFSCTTYILDDEKITIRRGFIEEVEDDAMMYKVQDVRMTRSLLERLFGLGTIVCYTGDTTHPELRLSRVKKPHEIKDYIIERSENARKVRRTLHSMEINANIQ